MRSVTVRALGMGAITGLRATAGPAALSRAISSGRIEDLDGSFFAVLGSSWVSKLLTLSEAGELIVDKLPRTQSRTSPPPLLGRAVSGAVVGAVLFASEKRQVTAGAVLGAAAAATSAHAGEHLRARISQQLGVPDLLVALLEDAVVLYGSARLVR